MAAQSIDPAIAASTTNGNNTGAGSESNVTAAAAAVTIPTKYWPSTPILNIPALNATATASAEKINGVAFSSTRPMSEGRSVENRQIVAYTSSGFSWYRRMMMPPTSAARASARPSASA